MFKFRSARRARPTRATAPQALTPRLEALEPRNLLSGNVVATLNGDTLTITGDASPNQIVIDGDAAAMNVSADGDDVTPTTINGAAGPAAFAGVVNIVLNLNDGGDVIDFDGADIDGNVTIKKKKGTGQVNVTDTTIDGNFSYKGSKDTDIVDLVDGVTIGGNVSFKGKSGSDSFFIDRSAVALGLDPVVVNGNVNLNMGNGEANVAIFGGSDTVINGMLTVKFGGNGGNHAFGGNGLRLGIFVPLDPGMDDPWILGSTTINGGLTVKGSGGTDDILITDVTVSGNVKVNSGKGDDEVELTKSTFEEKVKVNTSSGDDLIDIIGVIFNDKLTVKAGDGTDALSIDETTDYDDIDYPTSIVGGLLDGGKDGDIFDLIDSDTFDGGDGAFYIAFPKLRGFA